MKIRVSPQTTTLPRKRRRRYERASQPQGVRLTQRDRQLLQAFTTHRLLSASQVGRLCFRGTGERRVRRRLLALYDHGLIERMAAVAQPARHVPPYLYGLSKTGAEAIASDLGGPITLPTLRAGSVRHVVHHVTVCEFFVALSEAIALLNEETHGEGYRLRQWRHEWELKVTGQDGRSQAERVAVRDQRTGEQRSVPILPDSFFELCRPHGPSLLFFGEIDLSTHALSVWRRRAPAYVAYDRRGLFRRRFGGGEREAFRLLIVCPPDYRGRSRRENLLRTIQATVGPTDLFWVATLDELGIWDSLDAPSEATVDPVRMLTGQVWAQAGSEQRHAIIEEGTRAVATRRPTVRARPQRRANAAEV